MELSRDFHMPTWLRRDEKYIMWYHFIFWIIVTGWFSISVLWDSIRKGVMVNGYNFKLAFPQESSPFWFSSYSIARSTWRWKSLSNDCIQRQGGFSAIACNIHIFVFTPCVSVQCISLICQLYTSFRRLSSREYGSQRNAQTLVEYCSGWTFPLNSSLGLCWWLIVIFIYLFLPHVCCFNVKV